MISVTTKIETLLKPIIEAMGYELWGIEYLPRGHSALLRVYIDQPNGITIDDCEHVSAQVSAMLDVADPITSAYDLEVSSPGLDRMLFKESQYRQYIGQRVKIWLKVTIDDRKKLVGTLEAVNAGQLTIQSSDKRENCVSGDVITLSFDNISKVRLAPEQ